MYIIITSQRVIEHTKFVFHNIVFILGDSLLQNQPQILLIMVSAKEFVVSCLFCYGSRIIESPL